MPSLTLTNGVFCYHPQKEIIQKELEYAPNCKKFSFPPQRPFGLTKAIGLFVSCAAVFHIPPFLAAVALPAAGPRRLLVL